MTGNGIAANTAAAAPEINNSMCVSTNAEVCPWGGRRGGLPGTQTPQMQAGRMAHGAVPRHVAGAEEGPSRTPARHGWPRSLCGHLDGVSKKARQFSWFSEPQTPPHALPGSAAPGLPPCGWVCGPSTFQLRPTPLLTLQVSNWAPFFLPTLLRQLVSLVPSLSQHPSIHGQGLSRGSLP